MRIGVRERSSVIDLLARSRDQRYFGRFEYLEGTRIEAYNYVVVGYVNTVFVNDRNGVGIVEVG